jgi:hypothetical protein
MNLEGKGFILTPWFFQNLTKEHNMYNVAISCGSKGSKTSERKARSK